MNSGLQVDEKILNRRFLLPILIASGFAVTSANIVTSLLLIEIGLSFGVSVGIAGQIRTLSYTVAIVASLLLGALSIKFEHKSLLVIGLIASTIAALASGFSINFVMMLLSYSLNGIGMAMVMPMVFSLSAEYFSEEKRPTIIGYLIAGQGLSYLIGSPIISYISENGGWRITFLGYVFPVACLSVLLAFKILPSTSKSRTDTVGTSVYDGFKEVFSNRSAVACLIGFVFAVSSFQAIVTYSASFFRQVFLLSTGFTTVYFIGASMCFMLGSILGGRKVNRIGRKMMTVVSVFIAGIFTILYSYVPFLAVSLILALMSALFNGMRNAGANNLTLEQVPRFRGLMMSLYSAADNIGMAVGAGLGGYVLVMYDYNILGVSLGLMGIISAIIFHFLTTDPTSATVDDS